MPRCWSICFVSINICLLTFLFIDMCLYVCSFQTINVILELSRSLFVPTAAVVCPVLSPPENGFFIQNVCNNQFNSACGVRCLTGFDLQGDGIRLCQPDGTWSGVQPSCEGKTLLDLMTSQVLEIGHKIIYSLLFSVDFVSLFLSLACSLLALVLFFASNSI